MKRPRTRHKSATRVVGYSSTVQDADEERVEAILKRALADGVVTQYDSGNTDDGRSFWWNGPPCAAMRLLNKAIGGQWERRRA